MSKAQFSSNRLRGHARRAAPNKASADEVEIFEQWASRVEDARSAVAEQIVASVKEKWGTAVALEAATGICRTEISRIRRGKFDRFSLDRLVWLLGVVDPDAEVQLKVEVVTKNEK
jgi:predicted XRE-type DNA-binding protein